MTKTKKEPLPPMALAPDEMADSTREQQEAHVSMVSRTCRGRLMYDPEHEQEGFKAWYALAEAKDEKGARELIVELAVAAQDVAAPGVVIAVPPPPEEKGNWFRLRQIAFPLIRLRGDRVGFRCGWNQNEAVLAEKFDGAENEADCPNCGTVFSWKAPVFH